MLSSSKWHSVPGIPPFLLPVAQPPIGGGVWKSLHSQHNMELLIVLSRAKGQWPSSSKLEQDSVGQYEEDLSLERQKRL